MVMLVGDRGHGVGSPIKGFKRYGGKWKPEIHGRYTTVGITNEHNSSQTCLYCFQKVIHPLKLAKPDSKRKVKEINGSFQCVNPDCILSTVGKQCQSRDKVSALAIGLGGLATLILGVTFPPFDHTLSQSNASSFKEKALDFLKNANGIENAGTPAISTVPSPEKPKTTSRASFVKSSDAQKPKVQTLATSPVPADKMEKPSKPARPSVPPVPKFTRPSESNLEYEPALSAPLIQPRGLINLGNTCYMNASLQPLLHCTPFCNLIQTISAGASHSSPLVASLNELINKFQKVDENSPVSPENVYNALLIQGMFDTGEFRQEDSQEFLLSLLDGLHEDLKYQGNRKDESPITDIFRVDSRSIVRRLDEEGSPTLEYYQMLQLNIEPEGIHTVEDAIDKFTMKEPMPDQGDDVTKTTSLDKLPTVLILHLVRMVYVRELGHAQKLFKRVHYGSELVIKPDWLSPEQRDQANTRYQLFGSVYHQGTSTTEGHYTCDIRRQNEQWLHISDDIITPVSEHDVLEREENYPEHNAYMLFYIKV